MPGWKRRQLDRQAALERMESLHNDIETAAKQAHYLEGLLQSERERRADGEQQRKRLEEKLQHRETEFERLQAVTEEKITAAEAQVALERTRSEQAENRLHQEIDRLRQANKASATGPCQGTGCRPRKATDIGDRPPPVTGYGCCIE